MIKYPRVAATLLLRKDDKAERGSARSLCRAFAHLRLPLRWGKSCDSVATFDDRRFARLAKKLELAPAGMVVSSRVA